MICAPVVVFAYNRLQHLRKTIEALKENYLSSETDLIIYSDGPKNIENIAIINEIRAYLKTIDGFRSLKIVERGTNMGLSESIIDGVTKVVNQYGKIIVIEDDLITSPYFLSFINQGLEIYENEEKVISIQGYVYPLKGQLPNYFFIRGADCQGWATWKRGWDLFEKDGSLLLRRLQQKNLCYEFDFDNTYPYVEMLKNQIKGITNSWAIRWYASAFLSDKYILYPRKTMIINIGFGEGGTNTQSESYGRLFKDSICNNYIDFKEIEINENHIARESFKKFFRTLYPPIHRRIINKIESILSEILLLFRR